MNKHKLMYEMKCKNVSVSMLCDYLEISRSAFYRKCNDKSEFTRKEIEKIVSFLGLSSPIEIFFAD